MANCTRGENRLGGTRPVPPLERFWRFVIAADGTGGCWVWSGGTRGQGYGSFWNGKKNVRAHRFAYETFVGEIPADLELDHLCRNRRCVNPRHLEPVTRSVNQLRRFTHPTPPPLGRAAS